MQGRSAQPDRLQELDRRCLKRLCQFIQRHDCRIAVTALQTAQILLAEPGAFFHLLLGQPLLLPQAGKILPDKSFHVHAGTVTTYTL